MEKYSQAKINKKYVFMESIDVLHGLSIIRKVLGCKLHHNCSGHHLSLVTQGNFQNLIVVQGHATENEHHRINDKFS